MAEIELQAYLQEIDEAIERGQYERALAHGRHILQHYPKCLAVYRSLGKAMLEAGEERLAADMFQRVLSGDPEDFVARVGMSILADRQGDLQRAVWHMERAFELDPNNATIQEELRRLLGRRDGVEPGRVNLTRGALARLYMRGGLLSRAIRELRALVAEEPQRVDLRVALAEALWRNENRVQAEEACLQVLDELPYCLKANVLLGEIWARSGREEGSVYIHRAEALDPENRLAVELLGDTSPFQRREVRLPRLDYAAARKAEERPEWLAGVHMKPEAPEARDLVGLESAMETRIEIPSWLEEMGLGTSEAPVMEMEGIAVPDWLASEAGMTAAAPAEPPAEVMEEAAPVEPPAAPPAPEVPPEAREAEAVAAAGWAVPDWLAAPGEAAPPAEAPEWLKEAAPLGAEEAAQPTGWAAPDWLAAPGEAAPPEKEEEQEGPSAATEVPDWLKEAGPPSVPPPVAAEIPDWLKEIAPPEVLEAGAAPAGAELPDWLVAPPGVPPVELPAVEPPPVEAPPEAAPAAGVEMPAWLSGEELPSGDDALAWLESLTAGKEDELRAAAEAEGQARMAEIMGRPAAAPPPAAPAPEVPPVELPAVELPPVEAVPPEAAPAAGAEMPAWLSGEELPSGDDALAWLESLTAGREDELRAAAEAEGQARMAEIMGRPTEAPPPAAAAPEVPPVELPAVELPPVEELQPEAPPVELAEEELPDWLREPAVPAAAAAAPMVEEEIPDWLKELAAPGAPEPEVAPPAVEEVAPPEVPRAEVPPAEPEAFGWSAFGAEEAGREPLLRPQEPTAAFGWTGFAAAEAPGEVQEEWGGVPPAPAAEVVPEKAPPVEERPGVAEVEAAPRTEYDLARLESLQAHIRMYPRDAGARLALARELWRAGEFDESLDCYGDLLRAGRWVEEVIGDMEGYMQARPADPKVRRVLGDAYMRAGLLARALQAYREALRLL